MRKAQLFLMTAVLVLASLALVPLAAAESSASPSPSPSSSPTPSPSATPALTLTVSPATVTAGSPAVLKARLGVAGADVQLSRKPAGAADYRFVTTLTTDAAGAVRYKALPRLTTSYRIDFAGNADWLAASAEITVSVRPRLRLWAPDAVYRGQRADLSLQVGPAHPGASVTIEMWKDGGWVDWRSLRLDGRSRAKTTWRAERTGRQTFRVVMAADAEHAAGASGVRHIKVRKPNPYHVPLAAKRIVVVDTSQYRLYFFSYGREVRTFPCVLGRPSLPTPTGHFSIYAKGMWPGGPFGARIMSYHSPYAIHGTNEPHLLKRFPRNFSHGCTRLANANAIWLYDHAPVGTPVWNVP